VEKRISARVLITVALVLAAAAAGMVESAAAGAAAQAAQNTPAPPADGPRFVVTYVEVAPASESQAVALVKAYRDAARREEGNLKAEILQRTARPGHFVITEEWRDEAAWKQHRQAAHATQFQDKLKALRVSPYDERTHTSLATGRAGSTSSGSLLVVTHVDVVPPGHVQVRDFLKTLADASRKEEGNLRFDVLQGVRQNHFTVLEAWRDQRAYEAHVTAAHTKTFRDNLQPHATDGAPYDERLYRLVP
jgi:quinol monooxygenase YgiN